MSDLNGDRRTHMDDRLDADPGQGEAPPNPLLLAHRLLRGRYLWAGLTGAALAIPGAIAGYLALPVEYASTGFVEVRPSIPRVIYETQENALLPMFDQYVENEATYISSSRVVERAAANPELRDAGWPGPPDGVVALQDALRVVKARRGSTITVEVSHTEPRLAQAAVNAVLQSYQANFQERKGMDASERQDALSTLVSRLSRDLVAKRNEMFERSNNLGADTLPRRLETRVEELDRYDAMISQIELALAEARAREQTADEVDPEAIAESSLEELAQRDGELATLLAARSELEARRKSLGVNFLPNHRTMRDLARQIEAVNTRIEERARLVAERPAAPTSGGEQNLGLTSVAELEARLTQLRERREEISRQANTLGNNLRLLEATKGEVADLERRLNEAERELNALRVERENRPLDSGRVAIIQGNLPLQPAKDKRIPLAAAGAMGGAGFGVGVFLLYGLLRPTYRYIDDVEVSGSAPALLGTLPDFSNGSPEDRDMAALSVHHLRNALQLGPARGGAGRVLTITSAASGDGKTNLSIALGASYAAAGQRVCLLDTDLVGRGLSRELGMGDKEGFTRAVAEGSVEGLPLQTPVSNLWLVSAGRSGLVDPTRLSEGNVKPVLDALRERFDIVLIDTGPILGSLEANIVSALSDRVVLTVSRGQHTRLAQAALERLHRLGGVCAGLVFNRAAPVDFRSSVSHASIRSSSLLVRPGEEDGATRPGSRASLMEAVAGGTKLDTGSGP